MSYRFLFHARQRVSGSLFSRSVDARCSSTSPKRLTGTVKTKHLTRNAGNSVRLLRFDHLANICLSCLCGPDASKRNVYRGGRFDRGTVCFAATASDLPYTGTTIKEDPEVDALPSKKSPRICILGGGFGGLYTAVKLDELMWPNGIKPEVTLIDQSDRFIFKPLLYEVLTGAADENEVAPTFKDLLEPFQTHFVQAKIVGVDVSDDPRCGGAVLLSDGGKILYDWLVIAIGARTNFRNIPGVMEHASPFYSIEDVQKIVSALTSLIERTERDSHAVVVGGGYAGVELAAALTSKIRQLSRKKPPSDKSSISVTLVTDTDVILPFAPLSQRHAAELELKKDGINVRSGYYVKSISLNKENASSKMISLTPASGMNGKEEMQIEADLVMWTAGCTPATSEPSSQSAFPFAKTKFGSLRAEPTLKLVQQNRVFAVGDDAFIEDPNREGVSPRFPATAQVALQQADYVAWNLWAAINKRKLLPFRYQHLGDMMSLGTENAAIALPISIPKPINDAIRGSPLSGLADFFRLDIGEGITRKDQRVTLEGPLAIIFRRLAYWYRQPTNEQKARIVRQYFEKMAKVLASRSQTREDT